MSEQAIRPILPWAGVLFGSKPQAPIEAQGFHINLEIQEKCERQGIKFGLLNRIYGSIIRIGDSPHKL
jgi:hypothetical protein